MHLWKHGWILTDSRKCNFKPGNDSIPRAFCLCFLLYKAADLRFLKTEYINTETQLECALSPVCAARLLFMCRIFTMFVAEHVIQLLFLLCTLNIANYLLTTPEPILNSFTLYFSPSPPYTDVSLQQNHTQNVVEDKYFMLYLSNQCFILTFPI